MSWILKTRYVDFNFRYVSHVSRDHKLRPTSWSSFDPLSLSICICAFDGPTITIGGWGDVQSLNLHKKIFSKLSMPNGINTRLPDASLPNIALLIIYIRYRTKSEFLRITKRTGFNSCSNSGS